MANRPTFALAVLALALAGCAGAEPAIPLTFVNHLEAGIPARGVFVEKIEGSSVVYRVVSAEKEAYLGAPLHGTVEPFDPADLPAHRPYAKGGAIGATLARWLAATGSGTYACEDGRGIIEASFDNLVPNSTYAMWHVFVPMPPGERSAAYELPVGARDGSEATFASDNQGNASYRRSFEPCLQLGGEQLASGLAVAWRERAAPMDRLPAAPGELSHVQLFAWLPGREP